MATAALSYEEPGIVTILILSSFLLLLNVVNWILDNAIYCGLLGQVFVGVAWGTPGADWLSLDVQESILSFGYLGLILIVYEGGLSTSFASLWSNLHLSGLVALIGVGTPIGLSFILLKLLNASAVQAFAAGAALCSTSLGTTFTILSTSGLDKSRLGVILSSAAMLDDVAGLVMTQVISNLGTSAGAFTSITVIRPVFVSIAFAIVVPLVCRFVVQPLTRHVLTTERYRELAIMRWTASSGSAFAFHTLMLIGFVTGSSYAGTSNLFAAYICGAVITWWDTLAAGITSDNKPASNASTKTKSRRKASGQHSLPAEGFKASTPPPKPDTTTAPESAQSQIPDVSSLKSQPAQRTGIAIYEQFYAAPLNTILKPFFFASIGFSIPITQMFHPAILWRGIVYTILMVVGKLACGLVLVRFTFLSLPALPALRKRSSDPVATSRPDSTTTTTQIPSVNASDSTDTGVVSSCTEADTTIADVSSADPSKAANTSRKRRTSTTSPRSPRLPKPQSLYPAAMLGSAMVARGEIGFLISSLAESTGVFTSTGSDAESYGGSSEIFLVVTWAILLCTVIGPLSIGVMVNRVRRLQKEERGGGSGRVDPLGVWGVL